MIWNKRATLNNEIFEQQKYVYM